MPIVEAIFDLDEFGLASVLDMPFKAYFDTTPSTIIHSPVACSSELNAAYQDSGSMSASYASGSTVKAPYSGSGSNK